MNFYTAPERNAMSFNEILLSLEPTEKWRWTQNERFLTEDVSFPIGLSTFPFAVKYNTSVLVYKSIELSCWKISVFAPYLFLQRWLFIKARSCTSHGHWNIFVVHSWSYYHNQQLGSLIEMNVTEQLAGNQNPFIWEHRPRTAEHSNELANSQFPISGWLLSQLTFNIH